MNPILFLSLVIILTAALPWWPYSAYGRLRHHRPWDWLLDSPSPKDACTATESRTRRVHRTWLEKLSFRQHAYETKIFDQRSEILGRGATPEASQRAAIAQTSKRAAMKPCNSNSETHLKGDLPKEFEDRWFALERQTARPTV